MASLQVVCAAVARSGLRHSLLDPARRGFRAHASTELVGCCDVACGEGLPLSCMPMRRQTSSWKISRDRSHLRQSKFCRRIQDGQSPRAQRLQQSAKSYVPPAVGGDAQCGIRTGSRVCTQQIESLRTGDAQDRVRDGCRSRRYPLRRPMGNFSRINRLWLVGILRHTTGRTAGLTTSRWCRIETALGTHSRP
jgi:hypothetical protein